jgi:hypothetical protein
VNLPSPDLTEEAAFRFPGCVDLDLRCLTGESDEQTERHRVKTWGAITGGHTYSDSRQGRRCRLFVLVSHVRFGESSGVVVCDLEAENASVHLDIDEDGRFSASRSSVPLGF